MSEKDIEKISKIKEQSVTTWNDYVRKLPAQQQLLFQYTSFPDDGSQLAEAISSGTAIGVVDSSVKPHQRSAALAWIITTRERAFVYEGQSGCPSFHDAIDSYSREMYGIYVLTTIVRAVCDFHNVTSGSIQIACDNDSSLSISLTYQNRSKVSNSYFDLIWALQQLRNRLPIKIIPRIVAGHQERKKKEAQCV